MGAYATCDSSTSGSSAAILLTHTPSDSSDSSSSVVLTAYYVISHPMSVASPVRVGPVASNYYPFRTGPLFPKPVTVLRCHTAHPRDLASHAGRVNGYREGKWSRYWRTAALVWAVWVVLWLLCALRRCRRWQLLEKGVTRKPTRSSPERPYLQSIYTSN